jgi:hypothetical protein
MSSHVEAIRNLYDFVEDAFLEVGDYSDASSLRDYVSHLRMIQSFVVRFDLNSSFSGLSEKLLATEGVFRKHRSLNGKPSEYGERVRKYCITEVRRLKDGHPYEQWVSGNMSRRYGTNVSDLRE